MTQLNWVPSTCTLPTVDRPLREAEFDDFFASDVLGVDELPEGVRVALRTNPEVVARAATLAAREANCCSFFSFDLSIADGRTTMQVSATPEHAEVLAAVAVRARSRVRPST
ncbi:arsenate reductase [Aeromicrobium sp. Root344]|uniref:hypothetical protein n=1 Tax=Aeromicrobium sp. Root344 TaxID=1736521 RepID=UPI0006F99D89|nr:hypothetical protein [Aeromicrobium sp. Root344]KQV75284.1 arsenate reductase [Aeromicrobium sp. Root344]